ncbi:bifunctional adenosylcobinamide kinase/adenosylcobinamide-phosphate guanylyltransferase [Waterburya agarophytonicola K14]|uniref:Adenosylcobinamide kinase n=1 Tax=Waterburya agarophytonicola KI4 TaxID=2874699 RepID=A0A964FFA3_9CYAN|nr:bifunctional adenosylcobinamide kinase/adenosylcobinamide-phosphate guanylyltransferase [Waterburya agarophytonicola KI4]
MTSNRQNQIILVTGASRSGKSEFAEMLAQKSHTSIIYVATAKVDPTDQEWQARILQHQQRRPTSWQTVTISDPKLSSYILQASASECLLIDSLGTWIANFLALDREEWEKISHNLLNGLKTSKAQIILVGEETGWGVVPAYPVGRLFRDRLGHLSRQIASLADTTYLVAGGHVLDLGLLGKPLSNYEI